MSLFECTTVNKSINNFKRNLNVKTRFLSCERKGSRSEEFCEGTIKQLYCVKYYLYSNGVYINGTILKDQRAGSMQS